MEGGTSLLSCTSLISSSSFNMKPQFLELRNPSLPSHAYSSSSRLHRKSTSLLPKLSSTRNFKSELLLPRSSLLTPVLAVVEEVVENSSDSVSPAKDMLPKIDKTGRFCSPRAARELALTIAYAACLEGSDPVRLFEKRMNMRREPSYEFDQASLLKYNNMSFGGPPVTAETEEEAAKLLQEDEMESAVEAEVLSAPPKLVYSRLILRFTRKLLVAMGEQWDTHVVAINKIIPPNWKSQPAGRILELCILHMAMSDISVLETRHQIVINEAVDLAKRFCDGAAPRIINGCLRTFVKELEVERARSRRASSQVPKETTPASQ